MLYWLAGELSTVFFVKNASLFIGELITPEDEEALTEQTATGEA